MTLLYMLTAACSCRCVHHPVKRQWPVTALIAGSCESTQPCGQHGCSATVCQSDCWSSGTHYRSTEGAVTRAFQRSSLLFWQDCYHGAETSSGQKHDTYCSGVFKKQACPDPSKVMLNCYIV